MKTPGMAPQEGAIVITGGAGFIGSNLAHDLLQRGWHVTLVDTLSRAGVERNVQWLRQAHGERVQLERVDVRDGRSVRRALQSAAERGDGTVAGVFHLAAQVAVTHSLTDPGHDFEVNARGTLNVLQALRALAAPPPLIYTSTNKIYGCLGGIETKHAGNGYEPIAPDLASHGINERQPLDFQSPYGCSKGAADQYVLEFARSFGLPATVFRMSCIYGPHQYGTEDQGWIAHFLIRALRGEEITLFGDGCQVRDALYIDDLVRAFRQAFAALRARPEAASATGSPVAGQAFNIGGGPDRAISLLQLVELIAGLCGRRPRIAYAGWRPGDQRYYVSDTRKFQTATGWAPRIQVTDGIALLHAWLTAAPEHGERGWAASAQGADTTASPGDPLVSVAGTLAACTPSAAPALHRHAANAPRHSSVAVVPSVDDGLRGPDEVHPSAPFMAKRPEKDVAI